MVLITMSKLDSLFRFFKSESLSLKIKKISKVRLLISDHISCNHSSTKLNHYFPGSINFGIVTKPIDTGNDTKVKELFANKTIHIEFLK